MMLTKAQMMKVEGRKYKTLKVEELGGEIRIASISAGCGLDMSEAKLQSEQALFLFTSSIVDENNAPVFDEDEARQFIRSISIDTLHTIMNEITALSGRKPAKAKTNGVDGAEVPPQNPSEAAPSESSPTV